MFFLAKHDIAYVYSLIVDFNSFSGIVILEQITNVLFKKFYLLTYSLIDVKYAQLFKVAYCEMT